MAKTVQVERFNGTNNSEKERKYMNHICENLNASDLNDAQIPVSELGKICYETSRIHTDLVLMQVVRSLARTLGDDRDTFAKVLMDILSSCEDTAELPEIEEEPELFFVDAPALRIYEEFVDELSQEERNRLHEREVILPGPAVRDLNINDIDAWTEYMRSEYKVNVHVEYVPLNHLPWLETTMAASGLTKGEYYIAKYAVYFARIFPNLQINCGEPGIMRLCEIELN